jgi:hypothetical protein
VEGVPSSTHPLGVGPSKVPAHSALDGGGRDGGPLEGDGSDHDHVPHEGLRWTGSYLGRTLCSIHRKCCGRDGDGHALALVPC